MVIHELVRRFASSIRFLSHEGRLRNFECVMQWLTVLPVWTRSLFLLFRDYPYSYIFVAAYSFLSTGVQRMTNLLDQNIRCDSIAYESETVRGVAARTQGVDTEKSKRWSAKGNQTTVNSSSITYRDLQ